MILFPCYVIRKTALPGEAPAYYARFATVSSASEATRYATRELAEQMASWIGGPTLIEESPPTRADVFRAELTEEAERNTGAGIMLERFNDLFPPDEGVVTELPAEYRKVDWTVVVQGVCSIPFGASEAMARRNYVHYVQQSRDGTGSAAGKRIYLLRNNSPVAQYDPAGEDASGEERE